MAASSRYTSKVIAVGPSDAPGFAESIRELATMRGADVIFATSDASLRALYPQTNRLMDKATLAEAASAAGLSTPRSYELETLDELDGVVANLGFPMIVKPRTKRPGGSAAMRVNDEDGLTAFVGSGTLVQAFIDGTTRSVAGVMWGGVLVASIQQRYLRTFPPRAGTASAAVTEPVNEAWTGALGRLLHDMDGIFQAQFVGSELIDLNLRPYGSMPLALAAGLNLPDIVCRLTAGESVGRSTASLGVHYRWIDGDLRTLVSDVRTKKRSIFSTIGAMAPHRGTAHSITMLSDPRPGLVRLKRGRTV
jgi:predicted ATP-grasp superfamily ATP-dependent carboligase